MAEVTIQFNIDSKDFLNSYFGKQPKIFKNAIIDNKVTWAYINEMLQRSDINQSYFHLSYDGVVPKSEYVESYSDLGVSKYRLFAWHFVVFILLLVQLLGLQRAWLIILAHVGGRYAKTI